MNEKNTSKKPDVKRSRFTPDHKIFSICIYIILTVTVCTAIIKCIWQWSATKELLSSLFSNLSPFFVAFFIAYIMSYITTAIEKHFFTNTLKMKESMIRKILSLILSYALVIAFIVAALFLIIPSLIESLQELGSNVSVWYNNLIKMLNSLDDYLPSFAAEPLQKFVNENQDKYLDIINKGVSDNMDNIISALVPNIANASISILSFVFDAFVAIVVSIYMIIDKDKLYNGFLRILYSIFKKEKAEYIEKTISDANSIFGGFIIGKTVDSLIIGVLTLVVLTIFNIGGPYKVITAICVGITNMIPYFGPIFGAIPCFIIILLSVSPKQALFFLIAIVIIQQFDGNILGPYILGDRTGLRPIWIIFAITIGGWLWGVVGMFLGVPCTAVIINILNERIELRLQQKKLDRFIEEDKAPLADKIKDTVSKIVSKDKEHGEVQTPEIQPENKSGNK